MFEMDTRCLRRIGSRLLMDPVRDSQILDPITGYAQEQLLPLADACEPLVNIVDSIMTYVTLVLQETPDNPPDGLTRDESASICLYTLEWNSGQLSLYSILNKTLKTADRNSLQPWFRYLKLFLTALVKLPCQPPQTIWRGIPRFTEDFVPGTQMTWWAFSSCTITLNVLENDIYLGHVGSRTLFSIEAFNGRNIRHHSHFGDEDEVLLLPGTQVEIVSQIKPGDDLRIIHLKQKIPEEMQLEPPFEGI